MHNTLAHVAAPPASERLWYTALSALLLGQAPRLFATLQQLPWYRDMLLDWTETLEPAGPEWLEVGCGPAVFTAALARRGRRVTGLDRSRAMLRHGARLPEVRASGTRLVHGSAYALPFPDRSFDVAVAASLVNVVGDPVRTLREMHRVVRPGGCVSVLVPTHLMTGTNVEAWIRRQGLAGRGAAALRLWSDRARRLDRPQLLRLARDAGFARPDGGQGLGGMVAWLSLRK
jgi:ubiquinone/menaquinone biosynthesis C-methylase UbiE